MVGRTGIWVRVRWCRASAGD